MKTFAKLGLGCLVTLCVLAVAVVVVLKKAVGFFSDVTISTGPPSKPPSIPDGYQVEGAEVFFTRNSNLLGNWVPSRVKVEGVDVKTFTTLDADHYAKDATHVFYDGVVVPGAEPGSFKALESGYAGDAQRMYVDGKAIEGTKPVDAASFQVLNASGRRAKDKNHVYSDGYVVEGADPATFELLHYGHVGRDKNDYYSVSFEGTVSRQYPMHVDMASFKIVIPMDPPVPGENPWDNLWERIWAHDNQRYYVGGKGFPIADPATFEMLPYGYAKDSKHIYFVDKVLAEADPATFQIVSPDHEQRFINWSWSFARYGKDAKHVFYKDQILEGADPASFTVVDERVFQDKNGRYQQGVKLKE